MILRELFMSYDQASGQKINFEKSSIASLLRAVWVDTHEKYLGLRMDVSYSKMEAFGFLQEKVKKRLQGWREKMLSAAGKEILLKAVIQSIPTYVLSCFELPKQLCMDIHQLMERFWWGACGDSRKIHWLAWDRLCVSKAGGGMGFPSLPSFNLSLSLLSRDGGYWSTLTLLWLGCSMLSISR